MERRDFIKNTAIGSAIVLSPNSLFGLERKEDEIRLIDYHVHPNRNLTIEEIATNFKSKNMKFGIAEHPGRSTNIVDDEYVIQCRCGRRRKLHEPVKLRQWEIDQKVIFNLAISHDQRHRSVVHIISQIGRCVIGFGQAAIIRFGYSARENRIKT